MTRSRFVLALVPALAIALAPGLADARAGDSSSMGSRGSMTFSAPPRTNTAPMGAAPMQRTMTAPSPGVGAPAPAHAGAQPAMAPRSSFASGLMGGLIGAGIGGLLFGHGFMGGGMGMMGFLGLLLQFALVALLVRWLWGMFMNRQPATAQGPMLREAMPGSQPMGGMGGGAPAGPPPIQIGPQDYQQFEQLLKGIQAAWSNQDLNGLRAMATPEMLSYFNEQLSQHASRGVRNTVANVQLQSGDLAQAWAEGATEYATVAMRFSMTDVTMDQTGRIVDGSPTEHVVATELWTFIRARGGRWILSAIQQAR